MDNWFKRRKKMMKVKLLYFVWAHLPDVGLLHQRFRWIQGLVLLVSMEN